MFDRDRPLDVLTPEQERQVHDHAMRILAEIGTDVLHEDAKKLLADAGQRLDGDRVRWDPDWVMAQVAKTPSSFTLKARNPERSLTIGGPDGDMALMNVGGPPFASDLDEGRRSGTMADHDTIVKLTHATTVLNCIQTGGPEATDLPVEWRHMDMEFSTHRWSDKPYTTYGTSGPRAKDGLRMAEIVFGDFDLVDVCVALLHELHQAVLFQGLEVVVHLLARQVEACGERRRGSRLRQPGEQPARRLGGDRPRRYRDAFRALAECPARPFGRRLGARIRRERLPARLHRVAERAGHVTRRIRHRSQGSHLA
mgnify:CR=1 FL=1